jgi:methyl-accepting chemotaxis protein
MKLMLGSGVLFGAFTLFVFLFFPSRMTEMAERLERARATSVASALAKAAASALSFNDELAVSELVTALKDDPDARFATVLRGDGSALASWNVGKDRKWPKLTDKPSQWIEGDTLVVASPIVGTLGGKGHLILGLSQRVLAEEMTELRAITIIVSLLLLAIGAAVSWVLGTVLVRPTQILSAFTARVIAEKDLRLQVPALSRDEIGDLGASFTQLLDAQRSILSAMKASLDEHERLGETLGQIGRLVQDGTDTISKQVRESLTVSATMMSGLDRVWNEMRGLETEVASTERASTEVNKLVQGVSSRLLSLGSDVRASSKELGGMVNAIGETSRAISATERFVSSSGKATENLERSQARVQNAAQEADALSGAVAHEAEAGAVTIDKTVSSLHDIREASGAATSAIVRLTERIQEVSDFLRVIDEVAERTNLLALNASIVASQAGEHGRAFTVVANEVSELADRSKAYTKQIEATVAAIRSEAMQVAAATQKSQVRVDVGVQRGTQAAEVFSRIRSSAPASSAAARKIVDETRAQLEEVANMKKLLEDLAATFATLRNAGERQALGANVIGDGGKKMLLLTDEALQSATAQSEAMQTITQAVSRVRLVMASLRAAQNTQSKQAELVRAAINAISLAGSKQRDAIESLERSIVALNDQASALRGDIGKFSF